MKYKEEVQVITTVNVLANLTLLLLYEIWKPVKSVQVTEKRDNVKTSGT